MLGSGFKKSNVNETVFHKGFVLQFVILVIFVDDLVFASNSEKLLS